MKEQPTQALMAWHWSGQPALRTNHDGLINETFVVHVDEKPIAVLQRLNTRIFGAKVHEDIQAVTERLFAAGIPTPRLIPTKTGRLWFEAADGGVWRCLTYEGDRTIHSIESSHEAHDAARLLARFHAALQGFDWEFRHVRASAHDTSHHMVLLEKSLANHRQHRRFDEVAELAERLLARWQNWQGPENLSQLIIHGDPKISNIRFKQGRAHCLIDLDTMAHGSLDVELGDAMRSWCNLSSEDSPEVDFDLDIFASAMGGYAEGRSDDGGLCRQEWEAIAPGIERISLELAARFATDALEESYFGWNAKFGTRSEHNLIRARGQLSLVRSLEAKRSATSRIVKSAMNHARVRLP